MSETGNYILLLHLPTDEILTISKLGTFDFPAGWYAYAGSAFGPGGLVGRLRHHLQPVDRPLAYDYGASAQLKEIWLRTMPSHESETGRFDASHSRRDHIGKVLALLTLIEKSIFSFRCEHLLKSWPWGAGRFRDHSVACLAEEK